jgi:hypothetical protein
VKFDIFVLILDNDSSYIKGAPSYDVVLATYARPDTTVILVSANSSIERVVAGVDAETVVPPLPLLVSTSRRGQGGLNEIAKWVSEAREMRSVDGRSADSVGILIDFNPYVHDRLLADLRKVTSFSLLEEITPRLEPAAARTSPGRIQRPLTPKTLPVQTQKAPAAANTSAVKSPPTQRHGAGAPTRPQGSKSAPVTLPNPPVDPVKKGRSRVKVAIFTMLLLGVLATPFGQSALNTLSRFAGGDDEPPTVVLRESGGGDNSITEVPGTSDRGTVPMTELPEDPDDSPTNSPPEIEPSQETPGDASARDETSESPTIQPVDDTQKPSQPSGPDVRYFDIGSDNEPTLRRFGDAENTENMGLSCDLGGSPDWTRRSPQLQAGRDFSTISVPIIRGVEATVTLCIEEGDSQANWSIWLGGLPPTQYGCPSIYLSRPAEVVPGLNIVSWTIPAQCVHAETLMLVFADVADPGNAVWGILTTQPTTG